MARIADTAKTELNESASRAMWLSAQIGVNEKRLAETLPNLIKALDEDTRQAGATLEGLFSKLRSLIETAGSMQIEADLESGPVTDQIIVVPEPSPALSDSATLQSEGSSQTQEDDRD